MLASAAVSLSEEQASLQAATQAEASMPRTTLFQLPSSSTQRLMAGAGHRPQASGFAQGVAFSG